MQKQDLILRFLLKFRPFGMEVAYTLIGGGHFRSFCPANGEDWTAAVDKILEEEKGIML